MRRLVGALCLALAGCPWGSPAVNSSPTPTPIAPTAVPTVLPTVPPLVREVVVSGRAIAGGQLVVTVRGADTHGVLVGARVVLSGPTPATGLMAAEGLPLDPLESGTYSIYAQCDGYVPRQLDACVVTAPASASVNLELQPQGGRLQGRVVAIGGQPLAGVRVSSGLAHAFTAGDGTFQLAGLPPGAAQLAYAKTGYAPGSASATVGPVDQQVGDAVLSPRAPGFSVENGDQAWGDGTVASALSTLRSALGTAGFAEQAAGQGQDVRIVASPGELWVKPQRVQDLQAWVAAGGTLILCGEWGGAFDSSPEAMNRLAEPYGLAIQSDLVRSLSGAQPGWLAIPSLAPDLPAAIPMPLGVTVFESASVFAPPPARGLIYAPTTTYRIAAMDQGPCLAAARPFGRGLVVLLGDTSAWTSEVIPGKSPGSDHLGETNNREFMLNLFRW